MGRIKGGFVAYFVCAVAFLVCHSQRESQTRKARQGWDTTTAARAFSQLMMGKLCAVGTITMSTSSTLMARC